MWDEKLACPRVGSGTPMQHSHVMPRTGSVAARTPHEHFDELFRRVVSVTVQRVIEDASADR